MKRASSPSASHSASAAIAPSRSDERLHLGLGVIAEHVAGDAVLVAGVADADADAAEFGAEMGVDRAQAVVAGGAAAVLHLDLERREVELVVEDGQRVEVELVEMQRLLRPRRRCRS